MNAANTQMKEFYSATTGSKIIVNAEEDHLIDTQTRLVRLCLLGSFQARAVRLIDLQIAPPDKLASLAMTEGSTGTRRRDQLETQATAQALTTTPVAQPTTKYGFHDKNTKNPHLVETAHTFASELKNSHPASSKDLHPFPVHSEQGQSDQREMNQFSNKKSWWAYHTLKTINLITVCLCVQNPYTSFPRERGTWKCLYLSRAIIMPSW